jgi:hypothetical protein
MSFLRHEQIYQSDGVLLCARGEAFAGFAPSLLVLMSLQPAIPRRVALLHCSLPLHRAIAMMNGVAGNRQPPLDRGWGILNWRNGEFSLGVDRVIYRELGRYSEAERLNRRSLAIAETSHGSDTSKTATTMSNLGRVCADQGRNGEASPTHVYGAEGTKGRRPDRHTSAA